MRGAFIDTLTDLAESDSNVILLTGDLGFNAFENFEAKFPNQYFNVGVAEQNMMGVASGLALSGKIIFVYSIGNFPTLRCLEFIRNNACYHELNINIVSNGGGFSYGALGMSHHATEDLSILRALPGIVIVAPATTWEAIGATRALYSTKGVGYLRIDKSKVKSYNNETDNFAIGKAHQLRQGNDITLISAGGIAEEALNAADQLSNDEIECRVLSICTVKPVDVDEIRRACTDTKGIVTIEENNLVGGLGSCVAEVCMDLGLKPKYFQRIGLKDQYSSVVGGQKFLRSFYQLDSKTIVSCIREMFFDDLCLPGINNEKSKECL